MSHRADRASGDKSFFGSEGYNLIVGGRLSSQSHRRLARYSTGRYVLSYLVNDADPIGRAMRAMIIGSLTLFGVGLGLTLLGCVLAAVNHDLLLSMLGFGVYIAAGMGLATLLLAVNVAKRIWQFGTVFNRFSLVASPAAAIVLVWQNSDLVLNSTNALGRALYSASGLYFPDSNKFVALFIALFVQGVVWAALFSLPILAMHGLGVNKHRLNKPPHKLTDVETGEGQTAFWHLVCGYGVMPVAIAAWLPYFAVAVS